MIYTCRYLRTFIERSVLNRLKMSIAPLNELASEVEEVAWLASPDDATKRSWITYLSGKDTLSNTVTFVIMIIGIVLRLEEDIDDRDTPGSFLIAFGLFGFSGGVTNALAVKMLFDKIPLLYGSGIIPERFLEIRAAIKSMLMRAFFEPSFVERTINDKLPLLLDSLDIQGRMESFAKSSTFDTMMEGAVEELLANPNAGMMLKMAGKENILNMGKPMAVNMLTNLAPKMQQFMMGEGGEGNGNGGDGKSPVDVAIIIKHIDEMMEARLLHLTPSIIKTLMEGVIRDHLVWLVVWGNIFGGMIGLVAAIITSQLGIP